MGEGEEGGIVCQECKRKYPSPLTYYTADKCGDNAIPKNVKMFVNNTISRSDLVNC